MPPPTSSSLVHVVATAPLLADVDEPAADDRHVERRGRIEPAVLKDPDVRNGTHRLNVTVTWFARGRASRSPCSRSPGYPDAARLAAATCTGSRRCRRPRLIVDVASLHPTITTFESAANSAAGYETSPTDRAGGTQPPVDGTPGSPPRGWKPSRQPSRTSPRKNATRPADNRRLMRCGPTPHSQFRRARPPEALPGFPAPIVSPPNQGFRYGEWSRTVTPRQ